jgi:hypothetical protein
MLVCSPKDVTRAHTRNLLEREQGLKLATEMLQEARRIGVQFISSDEDNFRRGLSLKHIVHYQTGKQRRNSVHSRRKYQALEIFLELRVKYRHLTKQIPRWNIVGQAEKLTLYEHYK